MLTIDDLIRELEQETLATRRVLERVPANRLTWRPHEKSMTLGQLAMHVATVPGALAEVATHSPFPVDRAIPRPEAGSVSELFTALDESVAKAKTLLGGMDAAALSSPWRGMRGDREVLTMPVGVFLRSVLLNHWYHHRGQLTVYLRLTNAPVPAIYGASADEIPF